MSFKLHYRPETEIFVNEQLMISICQKGYDGPETSITVLAPEDIPAVIEALQRCAREALEIRAEEEAQKQS